MQVIGSVATFAIGLGSQDDQMRAIDVWIAGQNISRNDSAAYVPAFLPALQATERALKARLNYSLHESVFFGLGVEESFVKVRAGGTVELEQAWSDLRFAYWGPTTDDYLCFLLPVRGRLYLACQQSGSKSVHSAPVTSYQLIQVLEAAIHEIALQNGGA